jgi:hypothetical protein
LKNEEKKDQDEGKQKRDVGNKALIQQEERNSFPSLSLVSLSLLPFAFFFGHPAECRHDYILHQPQTYTGVHKTLSLFVYSAPIPDFIFTFLLGVLRSQTEKKDVCAPPPATAASVVVVANGPGGHWVSDSHKSSL